MNVGSEKVLDVQNGTDLLYHYAAYGVARTSRDVLLLCPSHVGTVELC